MTEIVLFHHVLGRTEGIVALGDDLAAAGHRVHVPDLFAGRRFTSIDDGVEYVESIGFSTILERGTAAVAPLPDALVYAGVSLGVVPAQALAMTRPGAQGAVLLEACLPLDEFGGHWPDDVPVQIHGLDGDPFFAGEGDLDHARALVASTPGAAELFEYPGEQHLFVDRSLPSYDADAAAQMLERVLALLTRIDDAHDRV